MLNIFNFSCAISQDHCQSITHSLSSISSIHLQNDKNRSFHMHRPVYRYNQSSSNIGYFNAKDVPVTDLEIFAGGT
jgi:hypothetical protein